MPRSSRPGLKTSARIDGFARTPWPGPPGTIASRTGSRSGHKADDGHWMLNSLQHPCRLLPAGTCKGPRVARRCCYQYPSRSRTFRSQVRTAIGCQTLGLRGRSYIRPSRHVRCDLNKATSDIRVRQHADHAGWLSARGRRGSHNRTKWCQDTANLQPHEQPVPLAVDTFLSEGSGWLRRGGRVPIDLHLSPGWSRRAESAMARQVCDNELRIGKGVQFFLPPHPAAVW